MKLHQTLSLIAVATLALNACQSNGGSKGTDSSSSASSKGVCQQVRGDTSGGGRNVLYRCNGNAVLNSAEAQSILSGGARVQFDSADSVIKAGLITRQSANRVGKSDEETCERAFINAAKKFQDTAAKHGGSRVGNFHSYLDRKPLSGGQYMCEVGTFHGRVVMRGDIAR
ncbi:hypothetical protein [Kingella kingae]|uniref:hypothetical protein n=1 Tax=Kingella kingae TaxID=504 RepID=UPI0003FDA7A8|nr:hypothetical protein [Kingella kingae]MDK4573680.1 excinuclease [Kingella kingae]MDK4605798.1 excinuclease [Kingella kingae]